MKSITKVQALIYFGKILYILIPWFPLEISEENVLFGYEVTSEYIGSETENSQTNSILSWQLRLFHLPELVPQICPFIWIQSSIPSGCPSSQ